MASLKDLIVTGPARFLDKLYGNLEGNAATADQWKTARTFTIGSKGWKVSGDNDVTWTHEEIGAIVSNTWTGGTTAGPTLSTTVNGVTGTAVTIPSASSAASGVVTIADQSFRGMKTFYGAVRGYMYNLNNNAPAFLFDKPSSHWTGIGACGENDTIFFGPCTPDSNVAGGYSWVANYNQKWKFQGDIYTTNLINATGTITSASTITGNRFVISNSSSAAAHIEFSRVGWNYIIGPSGSSIAISPTGNTGDSNARLVIESAAVYPGANNGTVDLGKSNYKWNNVYGNHFSGNAASATSAAKAGYLVEDKSFNLSRHSLQYFNISGTAGNAFKVNDTPTSAWWHIMRCTHANSTGYYTDLAIPFNDVSLYYKRISAGEVKNGGWIKVLDSNNYTTYTVKKDGTGASGTWGISITGSAGSVAWGNVSGKPGSNFVAYYNSNTAMTSTEVVNTESYIHTVGTTGGNLTTMTKPSGMDNAWGIIHLHLHSGNHSMQLGFGGTTGHLYQRHAYNSTTFGAWKTILDSNNYTSYTVTKTGGGASGTWGINVTGSSASCTGNAASATKLQTARTIFGRSFNGTSNVEGQVDCYGSYTATANQRYYYSALEIRENGLVGNAQSDIGYAPSIGFHWGSRIAATLLFHSDGNFYFRKQDGTSRATIDANVNGWASSAGSATYANTVLGSYTGNGGQQNPNYFGMNRVGFLMMNTTVNSNSNYKDWIIMDCYSGSDVGGGVAFGVNRQQLGAYIMGSDAARTSWTRSAELYGTHNIIYSSTQPTAPCIGAIWLQPV